MTENAPPGRPPDPPRRELRGRPAARPAGDRGTLSWEAIGSLLTGIGTVLASLVALAALPVALTSAGAAPPPPPPPVTQITVPVTVVRDCAPTVTGEGGPTPTVHPPSAPEGPDHQENTMSVHPGQHVTAEFDRNDVVQAIVLQVRGHEALVQEKGTRRAEWLPLSDLR